MAYYIRKIKSVIIDATFEDVADTEFEYYEVVEKSTGKVMDISHDINIIGALLKKLQAEYALNNIIK